MAAEAAGPQREIRRRNLSRVLYTVARQGPSSRAAVAARLGLTRTAVSTLVDELLRGGLLTEQGPAPAAGGPGRPGTALALTDSGPCGLGAEIGVDHLAVCAVDVQGNVRARAKTDSPGRSGEPEAVLTPLRELVDQVAARACGLGLAPAALAVAVPGLVARGTATVVRAPNLGWRGVDLAPPLAEAGAERDPLPLLVDNEANLGALAELWLGGGRIPRDFVHVSAEVGIGAAVVLDGALLRGHRGFAGEMGHLPVHPDGDRCACGGRGCLEQYAAEPALLRAAGIAADRPRADALAALRENAASGGVHALGALEAAGGALGLALAGTVNLLDPRALVLGGVLARFAPWLLPSLERELRGRTAAPGDLPELLVSELGADGPLLGAAHTAVRVVLDDPLSYRAGPRV
ncbi:ROK family protein [Streptomyces sp. NPDC006784]|uniref:ROK family transcriptional regulator n=1 Tax=Streptomyces sp. NPDC006784 TaxID=3364764 RepID=UPI0036AEF8A9